MRAGTAGREGKNPRGRRRVPAPRGWRRLTRLLKKSLAQAAQKGPDARRRARRGARRTRSVRRSAARARQRRRWAFFSSLLERAARAEWHHVPEGIDVDVADLVLRALELHLVHRAPRPVELHELLHRVAGKILAHILGGDLLGLGLVNDRRGRTRHALLPARPASRTKPGA